MHNFLILLISISVVLAAAVAPTPATVVFPVASIYASLQSHKLDFKIAVLNLM